MCTLMSGVGGLARTVCGAGVGGVKYDTFCCALVGLHALSVCLQWNSLSIE